MVPEIGDFDHHENIESYDRKTAFLRLLPEQACALAVVISLAQNTFLSHIGV